jgi:hypothetical protein
MACDRVCQLLTIVSDDCVELCTTIAIEISCGEDVKHAVLKKYPLTLASARQFTRTEQATTLIRA